MQATSSVLFAVAPNSHAHRSVKSAVAFPIDATIGQHILGCPNWTIRDTELVGAGHERPPQLLAVVVSGSAVPVRRSATVHSRAEVASSRMRLFSFAGFAGPVSSMKPPGP
jgi:hypothetical protein